MVEMRFGTVALVSLLALAACDSKQETPSAEPAADAASGAKAEPEADAKPAEEPAEGTEDAEAKADGDEKDGDEKDGEDAEANTDAEKKDDTKVAGAQPTPATPSPTAKAEPEKAKAKPTGPIVGKQATVTASVQAAGGYHCNKEYPHKFVTKGGSNVTYPVARPKGSCAGDKAVAVAVPYIPQAAGPGQVAGTLRYGICDDGGTNCMIKKKPMTLKFTASAP